jgi:hypothetical protein
VFDIYSLGVIGARIFLAEDALAVNEIVDDLFELATLLPRKESIEDLQRLSGNHELSERLRRVLAGPPWARETGGGLALAENIWLAVLRELIDFVTIEVPPANGTSSTAAWLEPLSERLDALDRVAAQVGRLLVAPRRDHDEVARIVHSFV